MKIRNLAFCGVMASILGMGGAYATDATIIASKAYVDARDNTKQDTANIVTTEWANTENNIKSSDARYPSMKTLQTAVGAGTSALDGQNADSSTGLTAGTVDANKAGMPVVKVTETDGIVTSELGTIKNAGIASDAAITTNKMGAITGYTISTATGAARNLATTDTLNQALGKLEKKADDAAASAGNSTGENVYTEGVEPEMLTQVGAIRATIAKQGDYEKAWNDGLADENVEELGDNTKNLHAAVTEEMQNGDNYVPTVKAVEMRVQQAEETARSATSNAVVDNWTNADGDTTHAPSRNVVYDSINVASAGNVISAGTAVNTNLTALDTKIGGTDMGTTATTLTGAIAEVKATADGALKDVTQGTGDGEAYVALEKDGTNVKGTKGILTYSGALNHKLSEINTRGGDGSSNCKVGSPCVLTMVMNGSTPVYEWTNMETDGLNADL